MKRLHNSISLLLLSVLVFALGSCASRKPSGTGQAPAAAEETRWANVTLPVRLTLLEPKNMSLNATATLVRGRYVLINARLPFGINAGSMYITPEELVVAARVPSRMALQHPVADHLRSTGLSFAVLQEAMLGDPAAIALLPPSVGVSAGGTSARPEVTVSVTVNGRPVTARLAWDLGAAKWDRDDPPRFVMPDDSYRRVTLASLLKLF